MKVQVIVNDVEVNANAGVEHFKMETDNSFLFETLIQFYKKVIESICRELSSNAWDQHIVAGKENVPFAIHLPTALENYFSISDFGTGISPEMFAETYCVFGGSDKRKNNRTIGGFGLGSKTPFGYSNNYLVTNRYNGTAYTYSFFRGEDNRPDFVMLGASETEESNGLTVQFSVQPKDFDAFKRSTFDACKYMQVKPTVNLEMNWDNCAEYQSKQFEQSDWFVLDKSLSYYQKNFVVLGVIEYPVDVSDVLQAMENEQFDNVTTRKVREVLDLGVYLKFDIGALRPIPSRESLMWNSSNTQKVVARYLAIHEYIGTFLKEKIETGTTDFEKALNFVAYFDKDQSNGEYLKKIYQAYASITVDERALFEVVFDAPHYGIYNLPNNRKETLSKIRRGSYEKYGLHLNLKKIASGSQIQVAVSSGKMGYKSHLKDTYHQYDKLVLVDKKQAESTILNIQEALKEHGADVHVSLINFDETQPNISRVGAGGGRVKGKVKANVASLNDICRHSKVACMCLESEWLDYDDSVYYVMRERTELCSKKFCRVNSNHLETVLDLDIDVNEKCILVLNEADYDKLTNKLDLVSLEDELDKKIKALKTEVSLIESKRIKITHDYNLTQIVKAKNTFKMYNNALNADSRFKQLLLSIVEDEKDSTVALTKEEETKEYLYNKWLDRDRVEICVGKSKEELNMIEKYYPLLSDKFSSSSYYRENCLFEHESNNLALFYIKQMDLQHRYDLFKQA